MEIHAWGGSIPRALDFLEKEGFDLKITARGQEGLVALGRRPRTARA